MIIAVDADSRDTVEAEHLLHELLGSMAGSVVACTHVVAAGDRPHLAISVTVPPDSPDGLAARVRAWSVERSAGAAITRPGASEPELSGPSRLVRGAYAAAVESALGTSGRLVRFPGAEHATGVLTAAELRDRCGIDQVEALGGLPVEDDTLIDTLDFIRPIRRDGQVVLLVQPAAGGVLIPFEVEHQQKCCADH
ncbi:hypothetical protein F1D05_19840 [Kribbella qitaiheensis]|uniref:Uncharacterized protein n=1 Tax=Kribbella qitaiheensis TaxID=1544730 RepID=A0A7G6X9W1_9ACTN|nr:hypothetical protein F1D05_19840 [Kribbella qitaiheensis]